MRNATRLLTETFKMFHVRLLVSCLLMGLFFPKSAISQINFTHYKTEDGLPHDFIFQMYQDEEGYIWMGTDIGLARYNGRDFKIFNSSDGMKSDFVIDVAKYSEDTLALAVWKGGLHFITKDEIFIPQVETTKKIVHENLGEIHVLGKNILAHSFDKFYYYEHLGNDRYKCHPFSLSTDEDDSVFIENMFNRKEIKVNATKVFDEIFIYAGLYISTKTKALEGIYTFDPSKLKLVNVYPFLNDLIISDYGKYDDHTYYAASNDCLIVFNKQGIIKRKKYAVNGTIKRFSRTSYCEVIVSNDFNTSYDEIYIFDYLTGEKLKISDLTADKSNILLSDVFVDDQENIWISSKADGLYKISKDRSIISEMILNENDITDIAFGKDGHVFFGSLKKLYGLLEKDSSIINVDLPHEFASFGRIKMDDNILYFSYHITKSSVFKLKGHEFISTNPFRKVESKGRLFTHSNSFVYYETDSLEHEIQIADYLDEAEVKTITVVKDELWISTSNGILIFDIESGRYLFMLNKSNGLKSDFIEDVVNKGDSVLYVLASGEVTILRKNKEKFIVEKELEDDLIIGKVNDIYLDHRGDLWLATQKGFSLLKENLLFHFTTNDGLASSFTSKIKENNKQIWIAGNKGVVKIDNERLFDSQPSPKLLVKSFKNRFEIDVIDFSGKGIITQYRTGFNEEWQNLNSTVFDISNYAIGEYNLQFRARNYLSKWSYSDVYPYLIYPPWYKTWWFILMIICIILLSAYLRLRHTSKKNQLLNRMISQSNKLEKELEMVRENMARDFHDELGNKIAGIAVMSEIMARKGVGSHEPTEMFHQIQKDATDLYYGIKDFVWSIDSKSDRLDELVIYLIDFGEELFQHLNVSFKVQKEINQDNVMLPYYWSRQLILLFKEAMTNTLKHAEASKCIFSCVFEQNQLTLSVKDNGKGFNVTLLKHKNGLQNMEKRAMKIGGTLVIDSGEHGTEVSFQGSW